MGIFLLWPFPTPTFPFVNSHDYANFNGGIEEGVQPEGNCHQVEYVNNQVKIHANAKEGGATNIGKMEEECWAQLLACPDILRQLVSFTQREAPVFLAPLLVVGFPVVNAHH
jgi:hypothetical protein